MFLRQSTAQTIRFGPFLDSTDGVTAETALTIAQADRQLSKDGAAFAQSGHTGNSTHDADGWYSDDLSTGDTDTVGILEFQVTVSGSLPVFKTFYVVEEAVYDAFYAASATGLLPANVTQISGSSTAADNLERGAVALVLTAVNDASATITSFVTDLTETTNDHYNGRIITFTSGNLAGQATDITDYDGTTKAVTVTALTEAPADNDQFVIS